jgi:hypothetical protein
MNKTLTVETFELTKRFQKEIVHDENSMEVVIDQVVLTEAEIAEVIISN